MNRKKPNKKIYFKESSNELSKIENKINNNFIQKSYKKVDNKAFFFKKLNIESYTDKSKSNLECSNTKNPDLKTNNIINNEINKTPEKRKKSNNYNDKNEKEDDLVTSFERKPSELKSPETISESSFTSSSEKYVEAQNQNKNEINELIYIDKIKDEINDNISSNNKEENNKEITKEKSSNLEIKTKTTTNTEKKYIINDKNNKRSTKLKITVNKTQTPRDYLKNKDGKINSNINENKNKNDFGDGDIKFRKKALLLTNNKAIKQKRYFLQTEEPKRKYKKKYINVNFTMNKNSKANINKNNLNSSNNNKINIKDKNNINNDIKSRNKLDQENKKKINANNMEYHQKKNNFFSNKNSNIGMKNEDSNSKDINIVKNKNINTLSRNISFNNKSKKIIYAPKKLVSSTVLKMPQKSEILVNKNMIEELNILNNNDSKINNENNNLIKKSQEPIRKQILELNYFKSNDNIEDSNSNKITLNKSLKNINNFFVENKNDFNGLSPNSSERYSINNCYHNKNNLVSDKDKMNYSKHMPTMNLNINNNILTRNNLNFNNLSYSKGDLDRMSNIFDMNNNSLTNSFSINFEDLIILQKYLYEMILSLSNNKPIQNECFEFWNYYYNSSLIIQFEKLFLNKSESDEVKISIYYSLMSIMVCYDYSFEPELFTQSIVPLSDLLKLNYKNLILICEYILKKISKYCMTNIWVLKLTSLVNESHFNDYTTQILKGYNFTLVEKISYNTNIILQNLRYLLKNFKTQKNGILTSIFKKIREKTYEEINTFFRENILHVSNLKGSILGSIFLLKNTTFRQVPNPYVRTKNSKGYSLVIDLDETLIHFKPINNGEEGGILRVRPGIYDFLEQVGKYYELIVFTTATQDYADKLIDYIEEDKIYFEHRFYREHASIIDNDFVKDLTRIGRPLDKMIIVDNMPQNFRLQKENGIIIKAFWGEDKSDNALYELIPILINIAKEGGDIRKGLIKYKDDIVKKVTSCFSK